MTHSYDYDRTEIPAAPYVMIEVRGITGHSAAIAALVDSGAQRTCVPEEFAKRLASKFGDEIDLGGAAGGSFKARTFAAEVSIRHGTFRTLELVAIKGEVYAILGRDFLNHYQIVLDGPGLTLSIIEPS